MLRADNDTAAHAENLMSDGYSLLSRAMDARLVEDLREVVDNRVSYCRRTGDISEASLLRSREIQEATLLPDVLNLVDQMFAHRSQILQVEVDEGGTREGPSRSWHRDLSVRVSEPLSLTFILYLDPMEKGSGPTHVIPGSHLPTWTSTADYLAIEKALPHPAEIAVGAHPGDALVVSGSLWHSGSFPLSEGTRRRIVVVQYGWWWIKRQSDVLSIPLDAGDTQVSMSDRLSGRRRPLGDLYIYD